VVADTFTIVWRKVDELPPGVEASLWVYGMARNVLAEVGQRGLTAEFRRVVVHEGGYTVEPLAADQVGGDWIVFRAIPGREGVVRLEVTAERQTGLEYAD
jgi:RNA polymerase sigma-70 factor (ECF subfamily)